MLKKAIRAQSGGAPMTFARLMLAVLAVQATGTEFADGPVALAGYAVPSALSLGAPFFMPII
jgi:hypothetical protein